MTTFNRTGFGKYQKHDSVYSIFHGTDAFLLEDELNESQWNRVEQIASALRIQLSSGITSKFVLNANNYPNFFSIDGVDVNKPISVLIDGYQLNIGANSYIDQPLGLDSSDNRLIVKLNPLSAGIRTDLVFLETWFEVIDGSDDIHKFGGENTPILANEMIDDRTNIETSRRIQLKWRLRIADNKDSVDGINAFKYDNTDSGVTYVKKDDFYLADIGELTLPDGSLKSFGNIYALPLVTITRDATDVVTVDNISDISPKSSLSKEMVDSIVSPGTGLKMTDNVMSIADTGISAGEYKITTVNAQGQVVSGRNPNTINGFGITDAVRKAVVSDTEPTSNLTEGQIWYNPSTGESKAYLDGAFRDISGGGGTGGGNLYLSTFRNTVVLNAESNNVQHGFSTFDKSKDVMFVYINSTFIQERIDYNISANGSSIETISENWPANSTFDFIIMKSEPTTDIASTVRLKNLVPIVAADTSNIEIGIPDFNKNTDILEVYQDNLQLYEDLQYTISDDGRSINLINYVVDANSNFMFYVWKKILIAADKTDGSLLLPDSVDNEKLASDIKIGSLAQLNTSSKTNVVDSINEVAGSISEIDQKIKDLEILSWMGV